MSLHFLLGVPSKVSTIKSNVTTLLNRWTQTLADRVDASISSRAPSSTALSTAVWTSARAAKLDDITTIKNWLDNVRDAVAAGATSHVGYEQGDSQEDVGNAIAAMAGVSLLASHTTADSTWTSVIDVTGAGIIDVLGFNAFAHTQNKDMGVRVTIDGTVMFNNAGDTDNLGGHQINTDHDGYGLLFNGVGTVDTTNNRFYHAHFWPVPFVSSFKVEMRIETGASDTARAYGRYRTF